jgi:hypothetical protein
MPSCRKEAVKRARRSIKAKRSHHLMWQGTSRRLSPCSCRIYLANLNQSFIRAWLCAHKHIYSSRPTSPAHLKLDVREREAPTHCQPLIQPGNVSSAGAHSKIKLSSVSSVAAATADLQHTTRSLPARRVLDQLVCNSESLLLNFSI